MGLGPAAQSWVNSLPWRVAFAPDRVDVNEIVTIKDWTQRPACAAGQGQAWLLLLFHRSSLNPPVQD